MEIIQKILKLKRNINRIKKLETINERLMHADMMLFYYPRAIWVLEIQFLNERLFEILNEETKSKRTKGANGN